jgi:hypothetical protein
MPSRKARRTEGSWARAKRRVVFPAPATPVTTMPRQRAWRQSAHSGSISRRRCCSSRSTYQAGNWEGLRGGGWGFPFSHHSRNVRASFSWRVSRARWTSSQDQPRGAMPSSASATVQSSWNSRNRRCRAINSHSPLSTSGGRSPRSQWERVLSVTWASAAMSRCFRPRRCIHSRSASAKRSGRVEGFRMGILSFPVDGLRILSRLGSTGKF